MKTVATTLKQGDVEAPIQSLWLAIGGEKPMSALLCVDGEKAQVSPSGDAVLYLAQTGVWVTPLQRTERALFTTTVLATHRDDVRYHAWALAQAVTMWNSTHNAVLPVPDEAIASLQSFMPDETLFKGFRYVWKGGALPANVRPADTVVAEIVGPGGWAQIFADGHTTWKSSD